MTHPFLYLSRNPAIGGDVVRLCEAIEAHPTVRLARREPASVRDVHAEVKPVRQSGGDWRLERFYWSLQRQDELAPFGFGASTLTFSAKTGTESWSEFPADAYLSALAPWQSEVRSSAPASAASISVLRYVPLRRFTFSLRQPDGTHVIGKIKRRSRFREAWDRLGAVHEAVAASDATFSVAKALQLDESRCFYTQSALAGRDLTTVIDAASGCRLMQAVAQLHWQLHRISPPATLPLRTNADWLTVALADLDMIALLGPEPPEDREGLSEILRRRQPPEASPAFCHGDFVCSQLLLDGDTWSVTDFDLCHRGDRYREIAMLAASLPHDLPASLHAGLGELADAYLEGYQTASGASHDRQRLCWHRLCAEIYYLALALRKGRYEDVVYHAGLSSVRALADELNRG